MTLLEITTQVAQRLNLTSDDAIARIKEDVRESYRQVLGSLGMQTSLRGTTTADSVPGSRYLSFNGLQKLFTVMNSQSQILGMRMVEELLPVPPTDGEPQLFAISGIAGNIVTIMFDVTPTAIETFTADALLDPPVLDDADEPIFPQLYHDLLVYGAKAIELDKMEKPDLAQAAKAQYQTRLGELRYFIAKNAYLDVFQNRRGWPWSSWPITFP